MDTQTGLDVLECGIAQIEATVFTPKRCLQDLRYSNMSKDEQMLEDMRREGETGVVNG